MARNKRLPRPCSATNSKSRDFAKPVSLRASIILGASQSLWDWTDYASNVSRNAKLLAPGYPRILFNGLSTAQRFHVEGEEQMCRVGCPGWARLSLTLQRECPLLDNFFASVWGQATVLPRRGHLFHDLITQVFLRSLQYGIVVMAVIDANVYAHNHHCRKWIILGTLAIA